MQTDTAVALPRIPAGFERFEIEEIEVRTLRLRLNEPFETSFGRIDSRLIFLVGVTAGGLTGWGEVVAAEEPRYSYETVGTARHVIRDYLAPAMLSRSLTDLDDLRSRFAPFRGHNMAKAGMELAYMDLLAQTRGVSLSQLIGGTRPAIAVGVSRRPTCCSGVSISILRLVISASS